MNSRRSGVLLSLFLALFLGLGFAIDGTSLRDPAYRSLSLFAEVTGLVENNYVEPVDHKALLQGAYQGLLGGLDPLSGFLTAEEYKRLTAAPEAPGRIGADVIKVGGTTLIASVVPGSPAEAAGLHPADQIWAIDGRSTRELCLPQIRALLSGPPGSETTLLVFRADDQRRVEPHLKRKELNGPGFVHRLELGHTGYVRVQDLSRVTPSALGSALTELKKKGATRLLLDLRGSTRGDAGSAASIAGLFIGSHPLATERARGAQAKPIAARGAAVWQAPVWILQNSTTAGAAELLAAALRDEANARLIGEKSCGYGARQEFIPLPSGDGLVLSVAEYRAPGGEEWNGRGLKPEIAVAFDWTGGWAGGDEKQLRRSLELITAAAEETPRAA